MKPELCLQHRTIQFLRSNQFRTNITRTIDPDCNKYDLMVDTWVNMAKDDPVEFGVIWENNSCWLDVYNRAGIQLRAGRIRHDQIHPGDMRDLTLSAYCFKKMILCCNWTDMNQEQWMKLRKYIQDALKKDQKDKNVSQLIHASLTYGSYCLLNPIMQVLYAGLPRVLYSYFTGFVCCDRILQVKFESERFVKRKPLIIVGIAKADQPKHTTLTAHINQFINTPGLCSTSCSNEATCTKEGYEFVLVLDQLPPTLVVSLWGDGCQPSRLTDCRAGHEIEIMFRHIDNPRDLVKAERVMSLNKYQAEQTVSSNAGTLGGKVRSMEQPILTN